MTLTNARAYVGFDTETTGLNPATARIIEAALVVDNPDAYPWEMLTERLDPGQDVTIPEEATAVHGIRADDLDGARPARDVLSDLVAYLAALAALEVPLAVYNAPYDLVLLAAELDRHGLDPIPRLTILDPLVLDRHLDPYRKGSRKLGAVAVHYGHHLDGAHAATADTIATLKIARSIIDRHDLPSDRDALHRLQAEAHAAWAEGYAAHLDRTGSDRPRPSTVWLPPELTDKAPA